MREERCPGVLPASEAGVGSSSINVCEGKRPAGRLARRRRPSFWNRDLVERQWPAGIFRYFRWRRRRSAPQNAENAGSLGRPVVEPAECRCGPLRPGRCRSNVHGRAGRQDGKLLHAGASNSMQDRIVGRVPEASAFIGFFLAAHAENSALIAVVDVPHPGDRSGAVLAMRGKITVQPIARLGRGHD